MCQEGRGDGQTLTLAGLSISDEGMPIARQGDVADDLPQDHVTSHNAQEHDAHVEDGDVAMRTFDFQALPYTQEEMTVKGHVHELHRADATVVCVDYLNGGIGSNSCGPQLAERYRLDAERFTFALTLLPS